MNLDPSSTTATDPDKRPSLLQARSLRFGYRSQQPVIRDLDLDFPRGQFACLLGPNGSGKTSLLRLLLGLLEPGQGSIHLDGRLLKQIPVRQRAGQLAYVPQFPSVAFAFSVRQIILTGRYPHHDALGIAGAADQAIVERVMALTDTASLGDRLIDELSGGERQRVMIARALAQEPAVLMLDEPTSHLDLRHQHAIYHLLRTLAHEQHMLVICVCHDINLAARYADRLLLLRDGTLRGDGPPAAVLDPVLLEQTFDVPVRLLADPDAPLPQVVASQHQT